MVAITVNVRRPSPILAILAVSLTCILTANTFGQVPVSPFPTDSASTNGVLVNFNGVPVYGFANIRPTKWLGLHVFHANFAILQPDGKPRLGNVAIMPSAQAGVFVFISDVGVNGVLRARSGGLVWEDGSGKKGKYVPL